MIEDCNSIDELREMAELDLQLNLIKYTREIANKVQKKNKSIEDIESLHDGIKPDAKLSIISSSNKKEKQEEVSSIDILELGEDLEDEEVLTAAAALLAMRLRNAPAEVLYDDEDYEETYDPNSIDDVDSDELFEDIEDEIGRAHV